MSHPILERLADADAAERAAACRAAPEDPAAVVLIDALGAALSDPAPQVARAASDALARIGRQHDVGAALRPALHAREAGPRWQAARALARLEPPGPRLLPALVEALDSQDGWEAARILVDAGRLHGEVLPLLVGLSCDDPRPSVRRMARHALRALAPDEPVAASALLAGTRDDDLLARRAAFAALASLLAPPREVLARLGEALEREPDPACRRIATAALAALGSREPERIDPDLRARLREAARDESDPDLRRGASHALEKLTPSS